ncbi:hypothetical protein [Photobacterium leiognathi]|uniref:hypothetical protein n=1 Tax=Photobacterium leiognathi TaxID=553611 RepID=UPI002981F7CF|nr:hypothetical protein [Photobacterium leiognathi]
MENQNSFRSVIAINEYINSKNTDRLCLVTPLMRQDGNFIISDLTGKLAATSVFIVKKGDDESLKTFVSDLGYRMAWLNENFTNIKSINYQTIYFDIHSPIYPSFLIEFTKAINENAQYELEQLYAEMPARPSYVDRADRALLAGVDVRDYRSFKNIVVQVNGQQDVMELSLEVSDKMTEFHNGIIERLIESSFNDDVYLFNNFAGKNNIRQFSEGFEQDFEFSHSCVVVDDINTVTKSIGAPNFHICSGNGNEDKINKLKSLIYDPIIKPDDLVNDLINGGNSGLGQLI